MRIIGLALLATVGGCSVETTPENSAATGVASPEQAKASNAKDGPFGFEMGQAVDGLALEKGPHPNHYTTGSPPRPHSEFETVAVIAFPETGICQIRGIGRNKDNDGNGSNVRASVDALASAMATKYGKGSLVDACSGGSVQCENQFWMMTLNGGERFYGYGWETPNKQMKSAHIGTIYAYARAGDISTSYSMVEYTSSNPECKEAEKKASAEAL